MDYSVQEFTIEKLIDLVEKNQLDLNPSYQRNFIWSPNNQSELIDTILKSYPLPNFFLYLKPDGKYEMVDGQQRTKTIYRFIKGIISASKEYGKIKFTDTNQKSILAYRIPVVIIRNLSKDDSLKEFYVLINKQGVHLNIAEVNKSEFHDKKFLKLANDLLTYQNLINLDLFTEAASKRMNDRAYVEELLGYLALGIKDKKKSVEDIYKVDINEDEYKLLDSKFKSIIDKIESLNIIRAISDTRYKQKNDFYTLFSFVNENVGEELYVLEYQYKILLVLDGIDKEGRQFIRPSNDDCLALKEYANNCVTQSNSKTARGNRLAFFNSVLKNTSIENNEILVDVLKYLASVFGDEKIDLKKVKDYELLNIDLF